MEQTSTTFGPFGYTAQPVAFVVVEKQAGGKLRAISRKFAIHSAADQFAELARRDGRDAYVEALYSWGQPV